VEEGGLLTDVDILEILDNSKQEIKSGNSYRLVV